MMRRLLLVACLLLSQPQAGATELQELLRTDQLRLSSWLEPASDIVVGQEIQLIIEVSTRRWFAGGTTIRLPDQPNLVLLRRDQFANNLSRREGATSWVVQRWSLELYPQAPGNYQLPPISVGLAVNDAAAGVVKGTLTTAPLQFSAQVPETLRSVASWLATPTFSVQQQVDRELRGLQPGDAITREVTLRASNLSAMMLPPIATDAPAGLAAYPELANLTNASNRGEASAERTQRIVYVVEQAGQYQLPEQVFYWWDTGNRQARTSVLPMLEIDAGSAVSNSDNSYSPPRPGLVDQFTPPRLLLLALAMLLLALLLSRYLPGRAGRVQQLRREIRRALRRGNSAQASRLLYQWLNEFQPGANWHSLRQSIGELAGADQQQAIEELLAQAYGAGAQAATQPRLKIRPGRAARVLPRALARRQCAVTLNPGNSAAAQKESC